MQSTLCKLTQVKINIWQCRRQASVSSSVGLIASGAFVFHHGLQIVIVLQSTEVLLTFPSSFRESTLRSSSAPVANQTEAKSPTSCWRSRVLSWGILEREVSTYSTRWDLALFLTSRHQANCTRLAGEESRSGWGGEAGVEVGTRHHNGEGNMVVFIVFSHFDLISWLELRNSHKMNYIILSLGF